MKLSTIGHSTKKTSGTFGMRRGISLAEVLAALTIGPLEKPIVLDFSQLSPVKLHWQLGFRVKYGAKYMPNFWWMTIFPSVAIVLVILGFNLMGDGIRDMLETGRR